MTSATAAARVIGLLGMLAAIGSSGQAADGGGCRLETFATGSPASVVDGRTFLLEDGRAVRLAAIEVPGSGENDAQAAISAAAKAELAKLLANHAVVLKRLGAAGDRYGHLVAQVFVIREGSEFWVEQEMIAAGQARMAARVGDLACAAPLLAAERAARAAKLGLWADPSYALRQADNAVELLRERGHFAVVEGKVSSVRESGGTIYINFGRVWSRNLTVTVAKRNERAFATAGLEPKKLESRRVRVRGWIEERSGPRIEATGPEQLEIADQD